ncbi:uncharacterized protein LOC111053027 [Nilaparvata lugens]|uniref:uncharacterized protein LOC111053027 n=1 Tax=Nilaparvata lugens TaxID=108931 RepID=UPI000B9923CA|nr:uncharacterized protein LOC111053027 [Nilaparvata lugens]
MVETKEDDFSFIPTRCSKIKNTAVPYKEVIYKSHSKKVSSAKSSQKETALHHENVQKDNDGKKVEDVDMKKMRYEVIKFARSNVRHATKQKTDRQLALELGARPMTKRKAIAYPELLAKKQKAKERKQRKEEIKKLTQRNNGKSLFKKNKKPIKKDNSKDKDSLLDIYGTVKRAGKKNRKS